MDESQWIPRFVVTLILFAVVINLAGIPLLLAPFAGLAYGFLYRPYVDPYVLKAWKWMNR